jgi:DNA (cytosine-5)-methyltransferase 1
MPAVNDKKDMNDMGREKLKISSAVRDYSPTLFSFVDLFAGIGGMRLALESVGGDCVFSSEWDIHAQKTYAANFGEVPFGDITQISVNDIPEFDVLSAGFPCQPFSTFGKRAGFKHRTQGTLFFDVLRIIEGKKPRCFILENVKGLVNHDGGRTIETILGALDHAGYEVRFEILNAAHYGVPQNRERVYFVGFRRKIFGDNPDFQWPLGKTKKVGIGKFLETDVEGYSISKHLQKVYIYKEDDGRPEIVTRETKTPSKTLVASYHKIQRLSGTFVNDGPTGLRLLTASECKALMGFPRNFQIPVSRTQMYRQMGNSVAVPVVSEIAKEMVATFNAHKCSSKSKRKLK